VNVRDRAKRGEGGTLARTALSPSLLMEAVGELGECGGGSNLYRSGAKVFTPMRFSLRRSPASGKGLGGWVKG